MSRKRIIYLGLLGLAVTAFLADRVLFSHTATAEAEPIRQPSHAGAAAPAKTAPARSAVLDPSLSWLEKLTDMGMNHDAFAPSWLHAGPGKSRPEEALESGPIPGSPEAFQSAHSLQATTVMGPGSLAVVDQRCLRLGDTLDGFKLTRVKPGEVEFQKGAEVARLTLPTPPGPERAAVESTRRPPAHHRPATQPAFSWTQFLHLLGPSEGT